MTSHLEAPEEVPHGIDRAPMDGYMPFDDKAKRNEFVATNEFRSPNKLRRLSKRLRVKLGGKTRESTDILHDHSMPDVTMLAPTLAPGPSPTTQNDRFSGEVPDKPNLPPLKEFVKKPMETLKSLAHTRGGNEFAENVADTDVSHGASVNIVLAHERIAASTNNRDRLRATEHFETLKGVRQESLVRWTMDRHIRSVKNVQALRVPRLGKKDFVRNEKMYWLDYGQHVRCTILCSGLLCQFDTVAQGVVLHDVYEDNC